MTKCKHILNWNLILDFFKWTRNVYFQSFAYISPPRQERGYGLQAVGSLASVRTLSVVKSKGELLDYQIKY